MAISHTHRHSHGARVDNHVGDDGIAWGTNHVHSHGSTPWETGSTDHEHLHTHTDVGETLPTVKTGGNSTHSSLPPGTVVPNNTGIKFWRHQ